MISKLKNPKTPLYLKFKEEIFSTNFWWYYHPTSTFTNKDGDDYINVPFYSHTFLMRPDPPAHCNPNKTPKPNSDYFDTVSKVFIEIFEHNKIDINYFLRINANCVHPLNKVYNTIPHLDHSFNHKIAIIYLTDSGGSTIVEDEKHDPEEDDVIVFGGETHYFQTPEKTRRVILIASFL